MHPIVLITWDHMHESELLDWITGADLVVVFYPRMFAGWF
jgi:hypothetical protein